MLLVILRNEQGAEASMSSMAIEAVNLSDPHAQEIATRNEEQAMSMWVDDT